MFKLSEASIEYLRAARELLQLVEKELDNSACFTDLDWNSDSASIECALDDIQYTLESNRNRKRK